MSANPNLETYAEVGDVVEWYDGGDVTVGHFPAVVTKVYNGRIDCSLMSPELKDLIPKTGVRHVADKDAKLDDRLDAGGWRHRRVTVALRKLLVNENALVWSAAHRALVPPSEVKAAEKPRENKPAVPAA